MQKIRKSSQFHEEINCFLVRRKGLEPPTYWFVASHSIQLSYRRIQRFHQRSSIIAHTALKMQALFENFDFSFALPCILNLEQYAPFSHVAQKQAQKFVGFGGQNFLMALENFMRHL